MELSFLLKSPLPQTVIQQAIQECFQVEAERVFLYPDANLENDAEQDYDAQNLNIFLWNKPDKEFQQAIAISSTDKEFDERCSTLESHVSLVQEFCNLTEAELALMGGEQQFPYLCIEDGIVYPVQVREDKENDNLFIEGQVTTPYGAIFLPTPLEAEELQQLVADALKVKPEQLQLHKDFSPLPDNAQELPEYRWILEQDFFSHGISFESTESIPWNSREYGANRWLAVAAAIAARTEQTLYAWHYSFQLFRRTQTGLDYFGECVRVYPDGNMERIVYKLFRRE